MGTGESPEPIAPSGEVPVPREGIFATIRSRVLALALVSVLLPSIGAGVISWGFLKRNMERAIHRELEASAVARGERAAEWLRQRHDEMAAINRERSLLQAERDGLLARSAASVEIIRENLALQKENYAGFAAFALVDSEYNVIAQAPPDWLPGAFPARGRPLPAPDSWEVRSVGGRDAIVIVERVVDGGAGGPGGGIALFGFIDPGELDRYLNDEVGRNLRSYLVAPDGAGISPLAGDDAAARLGALLHESAAADTVRPFVGADGRDVLGTAHRFRDIPFVLVSESPVGEVSSALADLRAGIVVLMLVFVLLMLAPTFLLVRSIVLPLEELGHTARHIRRGEWGLQARTLAHGELGRLTVDFNEMSRALMTVMAELTDANERLSVMSTTDHLTGIHNRRYLMDCLTEELKRSARSGLPLSVIILDIDGFKAFNDRHGHKGGDAALKEVARRMTAAVRETDVTGRFGGEEFLMILPDTGKAGAIAAAEKVRLAISSRPLDPGDGSGATLTVSLGVAACPEDADTVDRLIEAADRQLYVAKNGGRDRVGNLLEPDGG